MTTDIVSAARAWAAAGVAVVPPRADGSKAPAGGWKAYTINRPPAEQLDAWYNNGQRQHGVGLVCGAVSGNLELLELEGRAVADGKLDQLRGLVAAAGLDDIWTRLTGGYAEWTPSGGLHLLYRVDGAPVPGNTKLARRPARDEELTDDERQVLADRPDHVFYRTLAETRGEGGYVVVAPSHGPVHETGQAWTIVAGQPGTVPILTVDERAQLHRLVRALDEHPEPATPAAPVPAASGMFTAPARPAPPPGHLSPGDDFEQRTDWADILIGWRHVYTRGTTRYWRRPGKTTGISATTGHEADRDRLFVFSSSTAFDVETPYTKFGAHAVLNHNGDHTAAAQALQKTGYGTQPAAPTFGTGPAGLMPLVPDPAALVSPLAAPAELPDTGFKTTLVRRSQLRNLPPVEPLIRDVLSLRVSAVLVGATGLGKTFVALSWACSIATGSTWLGQDVEPLRALYVVGEGASGLDARITAWEQTWNQKVDDDQLIFAVKPDSLANPHTWADMREQALDLGCRYITLDTFSSLAPDADETKDAATITRRLSDLSAAIDGTALLIHHPGWGDSGRTRGGYQLEANVDEVLVLTGEKDSDLIELTRKKVKEGAAGDSRWLRRKPAYDSVIIESASAVDAAAPIGDRIRQLLASTPGVKYSVAQLGDELDIKHRSSVHRALAQLVRTGQAIEHGTGDRRVYSLGPNAPTNDDRGPFSAPGGAW